jgi:metallo-beta-lactamase class B
MKKYVLIAAGFAALSHVATAQNSPQGAKRADECASCAEWNVAQAPFRIWGNTYFVGTHGLSAILITSPSGHILIDGGIPESAPLILANIRTLGFRVKDVKQILNSHDHFDHSGGIAEIQKATGASVSASALSAPVLRAGESGKDDPQYGVLLSFPPVSNVSVISDDEAVHVGALAVTAHFTPGHTPGGTTWSWQSCQSGRCLFIVYADSQTPVAADGFLFTNNTSYPGVIHDFEHSFAVLDALRCDILVTPHPDASSLWQRVAKRNAGQARALIDPKACKAFATAARERLAARIASEKR